MTIGIKMNIIQVNYQVFIIMILIFLLILKGVTVNIFVSP